MTTLRRLRSEGVRLVTPELVSGEKPRPTETELQSVLEPLGREVSLEALNEALEGLMRASNRFDAGIDAEAAVVVHRSLGITRREAADPGVWRFLTVVVKPEFIRHRYENNSWATMRSRFWRMGTRPDSNTLSRLWWIAELTRDHDSYELTRRVLERQSLANPIFVRSLSWYPDAIRALVDVLEQEPPELIEAVMLEFTRALGTVPLEGQKHSQLVARLEALRELCRRRLEHRRV